MGAVPYTVGLILAGKMALVVGGGAVAVRKARALLRAGARVVVVAPRLDRRLRARPGVLVLRRRRFRRPDLAAAALAVCATDDAAVNEGIARECHRRGLLVNVVDRPDLCTFLVPSVHQQGELVVSVSTSGRSPALAKAIRHELRAAYGPEFAAFVRHVGAARRRVLGRVARPAARRRILQALANGDMLRAFRTGGMKRVRARTASILAALDLSTRAPRPRG